MGNLTTIQVNVVNINDTLEGLQIYFDTLNIRHGDLVEVTKLNGRKFQGFFKRLSFDASNCFNTMYFGIELLRIKKDGTPSKITTYILYPIDIQRL